MINNNNNKHNNVLKPKIYVLFMIYLVLQTIFMITNFILNYITISIRKYNFHS